MKRITLAAISAAVVTMLSGCSTIVFTNDTVPTNEEYAVWHHNVAYSLYELSEPVAANDFCEDGWSTVKVEKDVVTAIAGGADDAVTLSGVDLWDPWMVTVNCAE